MTKRKIGIRYINGVKFVRGRGFHTSKRRAEDVKEAFQERNHLVRIIPAKKEGKKGYYIYFSEKRVRQRRKIFEWEWIE